MATNLEIEKDQMEKLFDLLMIRMANKGVENLKLEETIARIKSGMRKENISWVEQMVDEMTEKM